MEYSIILRDVDGFDIGSSRTASNLKEAKQTAKYLASDEYARQCETSHDTMGSHVAVVLDSHGSIVFDCHVS